MDISYTSIQLPTPREQTPSLELLATAYLQLGIIKRNVESALFALQDGDMEGCRRHLLNIERMAAVPRPSP